MPPDWGGGFRPADDRGPVPVLLELLVVVAVRLAGQGDAPSMVSHCRWPGVRLWFWSEVAVRLTSSSALSSPTGGGRHRRSCRASRSWSAPSRAVHIAVQDEPCLSLAAAPVCRRPRIGRQCVAALPGSWCARRRLRCVSLLQGRPHGQVPGLRPRVDAEGGPDPPSPPGGQEVGDYRSLCWFGRGLCESRSNSVVTPAG